MPLESNLLSDFPRPSQITSHTVLVVDTSGSMRTHDVRGRGNNKKISRLQAVYRSLSDKFLPSQLISNAASVTAGSDGDIVSLVEFNDDVSADCPVYCF